jgi:hypothetical protein
VDQRLERYHADKSPGRTPPGYLEAQIVRRKN